MLKEICGGLCIEKNLAWIFQLHCLKLLQSSPSLTTPVAFWLKLPLIFLYLGIPFLWGFRHFESNFMHCEKWLRLIWQSLTTRQTRNATFLFHLQNRAMSSHVEKRSKINSSMMFENLLLIWICSLIFLTNHFVLMGVWP